MDETKIPAPGSRKAICSRGLEEMNDLITQKEIEEIKAKAITMDILELMKTRKTVITNPTWLSNGYGVSYSIDTMPGIPPVHHVSIGHRNRNPDPAEAECIAKEMLGEYVVLGDVHHIGVIHFNSCSDMPKLRDMIHSFKKMLGSGSVQ